jgi:hypothetical protein
MPCCILISLRELSRGRHGRGGREERVRYKKEMGEGGVFKRNGREGFLVRQKKEKRVNKESK